MGVERERERERERAVAGVVANNNKSE